MMVKKGNTSEIETLLDAIDKCKDGDETAFEGMTIELDGDIKGEESK